MRKTPIIGERILASAPALRPVAQLVRSTHERWDGSGYPDGLVGGDIPLGSRIVCACDAFHAMLSERPYRAARTLDEAMAELEACSGTQFDPAVVAGRLERLAARPEQFRLAVSLHAATSARRKALMPVEKKYPLPDLMAAVGQFKRRVTFEYVLIQGANDAEEDALALAELARPLGALVNLLPLHPGGAPGLVPVPQSGLRRFAALLRQHGVSASVRRSRGLDISAACGQLRVETERARQVGPDQHAGVQ